MIQIDKLIDGKFLDGIKKLAEEIIGEGDFRSAYDLSKELEISMESIKNFKRDYGELYYSYKNIIIKLKWVGLNILREEKVLDMFKYHFVEIFDISEFNIWEKLKIILISIILVEPRDKYKKQLIQALLDNQQKITSKNIIVNSKSIEPTVSNWLLDYNKTLGTGQIKGLARTEYLVNGKNIKNLSEGEKKKIKLLFDLYEKLKMSSQTFEGIEDEVSIDDTGKEGIIKNGAFEPLKKMDKKQKLAWEIATKVIEGRGKNNSDLSELLSLVKNFPAGSFERKAIEEEIKKLNDK